MNEQSNVRGKKIRGNLRREGEIEAKPRELKLSLISYAEPFCRTQNN